MVHSSVGPEYCSLIVLPSVGVFFSFLALLFDFFASWIFAYQVYISFSFVYLFCYLSIFHLYFYFTFCVSVSFLFLSFQCIGAAGVGMFWHGVVLLLSTWYHLHSCLCRSFVTTELVSLSHEESARALGGL